MGLSEEEASGRLFLGAVGFVVSGSWDSGLWFLVWRRVRGWFMFASVLVSACQTGSKEKTRFIRILLNKFRSS